MTKSNTSFEDIYDRLYRFRALIAVAMVIGSTVAFFLAYTVNKYSATATLLVQKAETNLLQGLTADANRRMSFGGINGRDVYVEKFLVYLNSKSFYNAAFEEISVLPEYKWIRRTLVQTRLQGFKERLQGYGFPVHVRIDDSAGPNLARVLQGTVRINRGDRNTLSVTATTGNRDVSVLLANLIADIAIKHTIERELKESDEARAYILTKINDIGGRLDEIRSGITALAKGTSTGSLFDNPLRVSNSDRLQADIQASALRLSANKKAISRLVGAVKNRSANLAGSANTNGEELVGSLMRQIESLQSRRSSLVAQGTSVDSALIRELDEELKATKTRLKTMQDEPTDDADGTGIDPAELLRELQIENVKLGDYLGSAKEMYKTLVAKDANVPENQQRQMSMMKRADIEHALLAELTKQLFQLDVQKISLKNKIAVLESSDPDGVLRTPSVDSSVFSGALLGALAAVAFALFLEHRDPTAFTVRDLQFFQFQHLGSIPRLGLRNPKKRGNSLGGQFGSTAFHSPMQFGAYSMIIKYVRTRLIRIAKDTGSGARVISIHSAVAGEGKTMVAYGIAQSLASLGRRVLFVDADVLGSRMRELFATENSGGLVAVLSGQSTLKEALVLNATPNLDLLPPGARVLDSTELLTNGQFEVIIAAARSQYDFVVVDTPPVNLVPDATLIAAAADIVTFVVSCSRTKIREVDEAVNNLTQATDRPLYLILNRVRRAARKGGAYNYAYNPNVKPAELPKIRAS